MKRPKEQKLSAKNRAFVTEYLKDFNGAQAAIRAGYTVRSSRSTAAALLTNPSIGKAIADAQAKAFTKSEVTVERTIAEFARIAYLDPAALFDKSGNLLPITEMPEDARRALTGMEIEELFAGRGDEREHVGRVRKIRFASKVVALDSLAKHLGMFIERIGNPDGSPLDFKIVRYSDA